MEWNGTSAAVLLGIYATLALDSYSAFCSSPQTTEININKREESLMYWVKWGGAFAFGAGAAATMISKSPWPLVGAGGVSIVFWILYKHAASRGRARSDELMSEDY
jgi:hypothetical protein